MADRDRRDDGRPEQARPRDRTGRPLPHGTTGVPLTEEHEPVTVEEALALGVQLWREQRLFEAHECLEHVWHASPEADRHLWQGFIQVAVAGVHLQRDNPLGAAATFRKAARKLAPYPARHRGLDVAALRTTCEQGAAALDRGEAVPLPGAELAAEGAWFAPEASLDAPPDDSTPVPTGPAWRRRPRGAGTTATPDPDLDPSPRSDP